MKTKKAMKPYTCYLCKGTIEKGQQYAKKSITLGYAGTWGHSKDCKCCGGVMPAWAYSDPIRTTEPLCDPCANPDTVTIDADGEPVIIEYKNGLPHLVPINEEWWEE